MKGQPVNRAGDTDIIRAISDNPGITCEDLAKKLGIVYSTIQKKTGRLAGAARVFRQKKNNGNGCTYLLYTYSYAQSHHITALYSEKPEKSVPELQKMFHSLVFGTTRS